MTPERIQVISAVAQAVLAFAALIGTIAVSLFVHRGTKIISRLEYERSIRDAWIAIDSAALHSDATLTIADDLIDKNSKGLPLEARRKRWLAYMLLNPLVTAFFGIRNGLLSGDTESNLRVMLTPLIADDDVYALTQSGVYEPRFTSYCEELRLGLQQVQNSGRAESKGVSE